MKTDTPKRWQCHQCGKFSVRQRRWCLLWGPVLRSKKKTRVPVCGACKKFLGKYY